MDNEPSIYSDDIVELSDIDFNRELVWTEIVCYAGFLIKAHERLFPEGETTEQANDRALRFISFFFDESRKLSVIHAYIEAGTYWTTESLPDVCGSCYHSYPLTVGGRYRLSCPLCKGRRQKLSFNILMDMYRLCPTNTVELVLEQLIYKYYSPNGDKEWKMIKTTNLL